MRARLCAYVFTIIIPPTHTHTHTPDWPATCGGSEQPSKCRSVFEAICNVGDIYVSAWQQLLSNLLRAQGQQGRLVLGPSPFLFAPPLIFLPYPSLPLPHPLVQRYRHLLCEQKAVCIQRHVRGWLVRCHVQKTLRRIVTVQSCTRQWLAKRQLRRLKVRPLPWRGDI